MYPIGARRCAGEGVCGWRVKRRTGPGSPRGPFCGLLKKADSAYFSWKSALIFESSSVVIVVRKQAPGVFGVCQFWMNCPPVAS